MQKLNFRNILNLYTNKVFFVYVFLFAMSVLTLYNLYEVYGDDPYFLSYKENKEMIHFLKERYLTWSGRIIIEACFWNILDKGILVWSILCSLCFIGIIRGISYFVGANHFIEQSAVGATIFLVPFYFYTSCGWIITTANYVFPLCMGAISLCSIVDILYSKHIGLMKSCIYVIAVFIAGNLEQLCLILLGLFIVAFVYFFFFKKIRSRLLIGQICFLIINLAIILCCPGNIRRTSVETNIWLPEFNQWSFFTKLAKGITHFFDFIFINEFVQMLIGFFILLCTCIVFCKEKKKIGLSILCTNLVCICSMMLLRVHFEMSYFRDNQMGIFYGLPVFLLLSSLLLLYFVFSNCVYFWSIFLVLGLGILSVVFLGFSPVIYASNLRVFIPFMYILVGCFLYVYFFYRRKFSCLDYVMGGYLLSVFLRAVYLFICNQKAYIFLAWQ